MEKNKKILLVYFISLLVASPLVYSVFNQDCLGDDVVLKRDGSFYIPVDSSIDIEKSLENEEANFEESIRELKDHDLVVFVHGTIMAFPSASGLIKTLKGNPKSPLRKKSFYHKYLNNMRFNGIYKYQPIDGLNLRPVILSAREKVKQVNKESTRKIVSSFNSFYQNNNKSNSVSYYTFGWSGHLNQKRRTNWSKNLYDGLVKEIEKLKKHGCKANVTILAHSHGGNVALKLAEIENKNKKNLKIKKLILFGTPIQKETSDLVYSDIFDSIYNIYSRGDPVQVIDFVSTKGLFSKRKFGRKNEKLPKKLFQIEVLCDELRPMHNELWFLKENWNLLYRRRLSVAPYPVSVFSSEIINVVDKYYSKSVNLQLNIKKKNEKLCFKYKDLDNIKNKHKYFVDFPKS
jgi:hypothetical protein